VDGIDVSCLQYPIEYEAVREAGFRFAYVKGSEGLRYTDPRAAEHIAGFMASGILVGVYGFAKVSEGNPREQAKQLVRSMGGVWLPRPALDLESAPPDWSAARLVEFAERYVESLEEEGAAGTVFYSYPSFMSRMAPALAGSHVLGDCPLWAAQYASTTEAWAPEVAQTKGPHAPLPWRDWALWQYSGDAGYRVPGVAVDCDRNLFRGTAEDLRAFFGRG